jgi:DNA-binding response OmpR family regulator
MRLLVVEDEPAAAALLAKGLREQSYAVDVAPDGQHATRLLTINEYDVVILDLMLPGISGLEVCRRIREGGRHVPVLMLTARDGVDDRVAGLDAGADDYLAKPFHFPELLARLRALLRRRSTVMRAVLQVADLTIDPRARRVDRAGRPIPLTAKEYALLEYLASREGEVVTRADIAAHVWDDSYDSVSNLIDVYIQRLRRKIDDGGAVRLIHTRRGAGYALTAVADV